MSQRISTGCSNFSMVSEKHILYSFRRCPYAIRARMALRYSGVKVQLRELVLRDKPAEMLRISPKGTVPVLQLADGRVIDESLDIMVWALSQNDPQSWLPQGDLLQTSLSLIRENDGDFKQYLDRYKYTDRFPTHSAEDYRKQACNFLEQLETRLSQQEYLMSDRITLADVAIFPFIRQFAFVDKSWFDQSVYGCLRHWLERFLGSPLFLQVMQKYPVWNKTGEVIWF